jgi:hypothetical protein
MDNSRFDRLTAQLANTVGRRQALGTMFGLAAFGSTVDHVSGKDNHQRKRRRRRRRNDIGTIPNQTDCAGVLRHAGCNYDLDVYRHVDRWTCPSKTNLQGANLSGCHLEYAHLPQIQLSGAFLNRAVFDHADLFLADLKNAALDSISAVETRFTAANLFNASLAYGDLRSANFQSADLRLRDWAHTTCPDGTKVGDTRPTCCRNLKGQSAKLCGEI